MPVENIPDIEDREFLTSQGHWTGDLQWFQEPCPGEKSAITENVNPLTLEAEVALSYPNIRTQPGFDHTLNISISAHDGASGNASGYAELTDGVYSYTIDDLVWFGCGFPRWNQLSQNIPADWDVNNTNLIIHFDFVEGIGLSLNVTHVNLESTGPTEIRPQYLPVMGVG